jgi:hypothetical protein
MRRRSTVAAVAAGTLVVTVIPGVALSRNRDRGSARLGTAAAPSTEYTVASLDAALAALAANAPAEPAASGRYAYVRFNELHVVKPDSRGGEAKGALPDANMVKPAGDGLKVAGAPKPGPEVGAPDEATARALKSAAVAAEGASPKTPDAVVNKGADPAAGQAKPPADLTAEQKAKMAAAPQGDEFPFAEVRTNELWVDTAGTGWKQSKLERTVFFNASDQAKYDAKVAEKGGNAKEDAGGPVKADDPALNTASLPTDPDAMAAYLTKDAGGKETDAFRSGTQFLEGRVLPLKVRIAVYRAMLKVPGVTVANGVADFAGRTGVAIGMVGDRDNDKLSQTIIDPTSGALLGQKVSLTKAAEGFGPAGTVLQHSAFLQEGYSDVLKGRPAA